MLIRMSIQAGLGIMAVLLLKKYLIARTNQKTVMLLWDLLLVRLLIPMEWILKRLDIPAAIGAVLPIHAADRFREKGMSIRPTVKNPEGQKVFCVIWLVVAGLILAAYIYRYVKIRQVFKKSIVLEESTAVKTFFDEHTEYKKSLIAYNAYIVSPVVCGIVHPRILLPMDMHTEKSKEIETILFHECIHIKRGDPARKWMLAFASAIHWFNPLVWIMIFAANRDIEHCCDELVLEKLGVRARADYAKMLVAFEEKMMGRNAFMNAFSQKPMKERIVFIMKYNGMTSGKKLVSSLVLFLSIGLLMGGAMIGCEKNTTIKQIVDVGEVMQIQPNASLVPENLYAGEYKLKIRIKNKGFDYGQGLSVWCSNENSKELIYSGQIKRKKEISYQTLDKKNCRFYIKCESSDPIQLEGFEFIPTKKKK